MPPSPGKIHSLPVKVLYNIDTTSQSYVTVLSDKQEVYIHPSGPGVAAYGDNEGPIGSCYLKSAVRGICYASPECIPNSTSLDFSMYNLDPALRARQRHAFSNQASGSSSTQATTEDSWTGKGFLSWILNESGSGSTLIKGRLLRDHDFSPIGFNDEGGLEGLMAAAARAGSGQREDLDGKGWGLEVCVSLKMVNPEGKEEFRNRGQFEEMLRRPANGLTSVSSPSTTPRATRTIHQPQQPVQPVQVAQPQAMPRTNGSTPTSLPQPQPQSHASSSHPSSARPSPALSRHSLPQQSLNRPQAHLHSSSSRLSQPSSLPPSSLPMSASSSGGAGPGPSRPSSTAPGPGPNPATRQNQNHNQNGHSSSIPPPSSTHVQASSSREVTPPPPTRKSPPPSTPSRERLHALLRTDEKMSPGLAKHLAANPTLLSLLKAVPASTLVALSNQQKSPGHGGGGRGEATTPTPSAPNVKPTMTVSAEGCCNCGTKESELWRTKNMKDGTKKKVCNACGLYFNKHKRMRPADLWGTSAHDDAPPPPPEKRAKIEDHSTPVRSSPRLHRQSSDHGQNNGNHFPLVPGIAESPRKRKMSKAVPQPSPRMTTRLSSKLEGTMEGKQLDFGQSLGSSTSLGGNDLFSPTGLFGTSPAQPLSGSTTVDLSSMSGLGGADMTTGSGIGEGEIDIEALLTQIANGDGSNGFSLDALFANVNTGMGNGGGNGGMGAGGGAEGSILDLLSAWENETKVTGQHQQENGNGNGEASH